MITMFLKRVLWVSLLMSFGTYVDAQQPLESDLSQVKLAAQPLDLKSREQRTLVIPFNVRRVFFGDQQLLNIEPITPQKLRIVALQPGNTQLRLFSDDGQVQQYNISVHAPLAELKKVLAAEFPDLTIGLRELNHKLLMSGKVSSQEVADRIGLVVDEYYPQVVDNLEIVETIPVKQIQIKAMIAEISHHELLEHGLKWPLAETEAGKLEHDVLKQAHKMNLFLKAVSEKELLRNVASPEMLTLHGRSASFEIGGKLPTVTPLKAGQLTVEYQKWGIQMNVLPECLENGKLRLTVKPHVSQLGPAGVEKKQKSKIPEVRTYQTDVLAELQKGELLIFYGMPVQREVRDKERIPLLSDFPLIGDTLYNVRVTQDKVELIILLEAVERSTARVVSSR